MSTCRAARPASPRPQARPMWAWASTLWSCPSARPGRGLNSVVVSFSPSWQGPYGNDSAIVFTDSTDSFADGSSTAYESLTSQSGSGTYQVQFVSVTDKAGNSRYYYPGELQALGFQTSFTVQGGGVADTTQPVLTGLSF